MRVLLREEGGLGSGPTTDEPAKPPSVGEIAEQVSALRGLPIQQPVKAELLDGAGFSDLMQRLQRRFSACAPPTGRSTPPPRWWRPMRSPRIAGPGVRSPASRGHRGRRRLPRVQLGGRPGEGWGEVDRGTFSAFDPRCLHVGAVAEPAEHGPMVWTGCAFGCSTFGDGVAPQRLISRNASRFDRPDRRPLLATTKRSTASGLVFEYSRNAQPIALRMKKSVSSARRRQ
jgi:hypothetical protein